MKAGNRAAAAEDRRSAGTSARRFKPSTTTASARLTERERMVLCELANGYSVGRIGADNFLSHHTIRSHVRSATRKLGARSRTHAVALAIISGEVELDRESGESAG